MKKITMRDTFWNRVYDIAREDKNVIVVAADMGAPALDKFRRDFTNQFINTGIAEQNAMLVSTGLAMAGKKVFVYAIAPFITMRCYEQIRIYPAGMDLPITIVGVGAGICYEESGPTHHAVEDITILRGLPNMEIFSASDNNMTARFADLAYKSKHPNYVRLDRIVLPNIYDEKEEFTQGLGILRALGDVNILSTGCMINTAMKVSDSLAKEGIKVGVIDAYKIPLNQDLFVNMVNNTKSLITLEEHSLAGGLGSHICELVMDAGLNVRVKRIGFDFSKKYSYDYGGRSVVHPLYGLDAESVKKTVKDLI